MSTNSRVAVPGGSRALGSRSKKSEALCGNYQDMASKERGNMKSKKKKQSVPTSSTMPNMSHPLPYPPRSTSLPSTMFTIPPPSNNSAQYYSMPAKGSQSNTVFNFVPTPSIPLSSPGFHGSQHGGSLAVAPSVFYGSQPTDSPAVAPPGFHGSQHTGSPAAAPPRFHGSQHTGSPADAPPRFHGSQHTGSPADAPPSFHGSQHTGSPADAPLSFHGSHHTGSPADAPPSFHGSRHDGASFVAPSSSSPSSSSIPSISRLDIGGSRRGTSSAASAPSRRRRQNLGGDLQFDNYNRLIIVPYKNGFLPSFQATHRVTDSMKPFYHESWTSWKGIPYNIRDQMWNQFRTRCTWHPQHQNAVNINYEKIARIRIKDSMCAARTSGKMPDWLRKDVWDKLLEKWNTAEWKAKSEQAKANRASKKGGSLHTGGSITFEAHKLRMEKERGRDMTYAEVFEELHKKKKKDGTREDWVETRALDTYEDYHKRLEEWQQTQSLSTQPTPDDMASLWTAAAGGVNKGRVYGLGVHRPTCHPNPLLDNSSPQNQEKMENMENKIRGLEQQLESQSGMFVKMQKFMHKHGYDLSGDEDEQSASDV